MKMFRTIRRCVGFMAICLVLSGILAGCSTLPQKRSDAVKDAVECTEEEPGWLGLECDAERGNTHAQLVLARMYFTGQGVAQDNAEAVKWIRKAAEGGHEVAQRELGWMYADGSMGVAQNSAEAVKWFRKAAEQGDKWSQHQLGVRYAEGWGVAKNEVEAVKWFQKAAKQGNEESQYRLGLMYGEGRGVAQSNAEAEKWFRAAKRLHKDAQAMLEAMKAQDFEAVKRMAERGDAAFQNTLAEMYYVDYRGQGITQSYAEAAKWWRKAAEQGYAESQHDLGMMYATGWGIARNDAEAVKWFRKAAKQGYAWSQHNLGAMYANGWGVARNEAEALKWLRKAAAQGHKNAKRVLEALKK